jgi:DNA/RNA endonuclease YhcR with UshA esterase domain
MRKLCTVLAVLALAVAARANAVVISIDDARSLPAGTVVTVEGAVTAASGAFATSTFDQGFGIQDNTAGIYVSTADNPILDLFEKVRVTGELADDGFGQLVLRPASLAGVQKRPGLKHVAPDAVATGDIGEDTEGSLMEITGTVTQIVNDLPYGYKVFVDDGSGETQIFIASSTGVNPYTLPFIQLGARITGVGFSSQFLTDYEILPRHRLDLRRAFP